MSDYDYIIVGAGSAGCVLAARLSEDPAVRVLLLEAGPRNRAREIGIPAAFSKLFKSRFDWGFETEPEQRLDGRRIYVPRGKTLGGSSSINAQMVVRGRREDFDGWGLPGWGYESLLPYFKRAERNSRGAGPFHAGDGAQHVQDPRDPSPLSRAFVAAAEAAGIPRTDDFNGSTPEGAGLVQVNQRRGRRHSATDAYLRPAGRRRNLAVVTDAHVRSVSFEGRRATGVAYSHAGAEEAATARREVILSAGAIGSPQLLLLSGVGPAEHLDAYGIDVVHDLPGVGQNLQDHLGVPVHFRIGLPLSLAAADTPRNLAAYLLRRRGMLASNVAEAAAFVRSADELAAPDLELIFAPVLYVSEGLEPPPEHGVTIGAIALQPESRGTVALASADPFAPPAIRPCYLSDPDAADLRVLVEGIRLARRIAATRPLAEHVTGELGPGDEATSRAQLEAWVRSKAHTIYHPVGTCRMGKDVGAVVDPDLRVLGVERLRVVDASVMPAIVRGHTHSATLAIAERAAELIRHGSWQRRVVAPEAQTALV